MMANDTDTEAPDLTPGEQLRVRTDFLEWSGAEKVCETDVKDLEVYLELARPADLDADAVEEYLLHCVDAGL